MKDRIRQLRHSLNMTQEEFASHIGVKRNTVSLYESGRNTPILSVINLICKEFNVSKEWLLKGVGKMFVSQPYNSLDQLAAENDLSVFDYLLLEKYMSLSKNDRAAVVRYMRQVGEAFANTQTGSDRLPFLPVSEDDESPDVYPEYPASTNESPASANESPASANEYPASANEYPASANEYPASANEVAASTGIDNAHIVNASADIDYAVNTNADIDYTANTNADFDYTANNSAAMMAASIPLQAIAADKVQNPLPGGYAAKTPDGHDTNENDDCRDTDADIDSLDVPTETDCCDVRAKSNK